MNRRVIVAIDELPRSTVAARQKPYREMFGGDSKSSKQFLFRRIAWSLQANAEGDLSERARRRATEIPNPSLDNSLTCEGARGLRQPRGNRQTCLKLASPP